MPGKRKLPGLAFEQSDGVVGSPRPLFEKHLSNDGAHSPTPTYATPSEWKPAAACGRSPEPCGHVAVSRHAIAQETTMAATWRQIELNVGSALECAERATWTINELVGRTLETAVTGREVATTLHHAYSAQVHVAREEWAQEGAQEILEGNCHRHRTIERHLVRPWWTICRATD
jgi:hypothetical protein